MKVFLVIIFLTHTGLETVTRPMPNIEACQQIVEHVLADIGTKETSITVGDRWIRLDTIKDIECRYIIDI